MVAVRPSPPAFGENPDQHLTANPGVVMETDTEAQTLLLVVVLRAPREQQLWMIDLLPSNQKLVDQQRKGGNLI